MNTPKPTRSTTARIAAGTTSDGPAEARRPCRAQPRELLELGAVRETEGDEGGEAPDEQPRGDRHRDREHAGERDEHEAGDEQHEQPVPVRGVERVEQEQPEERLRERDLEPGEIRELVDAGEELHHDRDGQHRLHDAHGQRPGPPGQVADRERRRAARRAPRPRGRRRRHPRWSAAIAAAMTAMHTKTRSATTSCARAHVGDPAEPVHGRARRERTLRRRCRRRRARAAGRRASGVGTTPTRGPSTSAVASSTRAPARSASSAMPAARDATSSGSGPRRSTTRITSGRRGTFVLAHHHHAGARGRGPVHRADRVAVEVLAHAAGQLGAAGREVGELGRHLGVADHDRARGWARGGARRRPAPAAAPGGVGASGRDRAARR